MTKELKEKDLDVVELDDDLLESVIGGIASLQLGGYPSVQCSKCKKSFSLVDFGYNSLGYAGSVSKSRLIMKASAMDNKTRTKLFGSMFYRL